MPLEMAAMAGPAPPALPQIESSQPTSQDSRIRKYFPETWIWNCSSIGSVKKDVISSLTRLTMLCFS